MTTKTVQRPLRLPLPPGAQTEGVVMPLQWVHHPGGLEDGGWSQRDSLSLLNPQNLIEFFLPSYRLALNPWEWECPSYACPFRMGMSMLCLSLHCILEAEN